MGVTLGELSRTSQRQLDLLTSDEPIRRRMEVVRGDYPVAAPLELQGEAIAPIHI